MNIVMLFGELFNGWIFISLPFVSFFVLLTIQKVKKVRISLFERVLVFYTSSLLMTYYVFWEPHLKAGYSLDHEATNFFVIYLAPVLTFLMLLLFHFIAKKLVFEYEKERG